MAEDVEGEENDPAEDDVPALGEEYVPDLWIDSNMYIRIIKYSISK